MSALMVLQYAPVMRGFLVLLAAGIVFPLVGVFVLRLNLITLRFALMHSSLLGSAIALAAGFNPLLIGMLANTAVVLSIARLRTKTNQNVGFITTFFMVLTVGLAFAVIYRFNVSTNDSLQILWGNIYAMTPFDARMTAVYAACVVAFVVVLFPRLAAVLYDKDVATSIGINEPLVYTAIILMVGLTITFVMRLIGALLLDAILILPPLMAIAVAKSMRGTFILASVFGLTVAIGGFALAIFADLPASSGVTIFGALLFAGVHIITARHKRKKPFQEERNNAEISPNAAHGSDRFDVHGVRRGSE
ncbi:MAG: metal ABC transporter permease [Spirochaetaceae bacterium]|nr:MAG: metal ABC transporter permease [Spirochaetaceae bacterium]